MNHRHSLRATARVVLVALTTSLLAPGFLVAQTNEISVGKRISLVFDVGLVIGGPSNSLYDQLDEAEFNSNRRSCFGEVTVDDSDPVHGGMVAGEICGSRHYPVRASPGAGYGLNVRFAVSEFASVGVGFNEADLGGAAGHNEAWERYNSTEWTSRGYSVTMFWTRDRIRFGLGGSVYRLKNTMAIRMDADRASRVGLVTELGFQSSSSSQFVLDLAIRVHVVPSQDLEFPTALPDDPVLTLRPNWSHVTVSVGLGIRP